MGAVVSGGTNSPLGTEAATPALARSAKLYVRLVSNLNMSVGIDVGTDTNR